MFLRFYLFKWHLNVRIILLTPTRASIAWWFHSDMNKSLSWILILSDEFGHFLRRKKREYWLHFKATTSSRMHFSNELQPVLGFLFLKQKEQNYVMHSSSYFFGVMTDFLYTLKMFLNGIDSLSIDYLPTILFIQMAPLCEDCPPHSHHWVQLTTDWWSDPARTWTGFKCMTVLDHI